MVKNPKEVLEIGTYMGHTAKAMAENLSGAIIHTVDLPPNHAFDGDSEAKMDKGDRDLIAKRIVGREFCDQQFSSQIQQHFHDTATWDFSEVGSPTFFFIDGVSQLRILQERL